MTVPSARETSSSPHCHHLLPPSRRQRRLTVTDGAAPTADKPVRSPRSCRARPGRRSVLLRAMPPHRRPAWEQRGLRDRLPRPAAPARGTGRRPGHSRALTYDRPRGDPSRLICDVQEPANTITGPVCAPTPEWSPVVTGDTLINAANAPASGDMSATMTGPLFGGQRSQVTGQRS